MLMIKLKILTGMRSISGILSVLLILICGPFILKFFTKQLPLMIFCSKLTTEIPLTVIFEINSPNRLFIFSVNVILLDPFGKSCSRLLKINMILIFQLQILIRFLEFLETNS